MRRNSLVMILVCALALAGCQRARHSDAAPTSGTVERSVTVDGVARAYRVHVPARLARPAPLLVVLHGGGGNGSQVEQQTGFTTTADREGFVVAYPDGSGRTRPEQMLRRLAEVDAETGRSWARPPRPGRAADRNSVSASSTVSPVSRDRHAAAGRLLLSVATPASLAWIGYGWALLHTNFREPGAPRHRRRQSRCAGRRTTTVCRRLLPHSS